MLISKYIEKANINATLAVVADLHDTCCGEVLSMLKEISPDLILAPGDIFERHQGKGGNGIPAEKSFMTKLLTDTAGWVDGKMKKIGRGVEMVPSNGYEFLIGANKIAPVIMSIGNHDVPFQDEDMEMIEKSGTILLDNADTSITVNGGKILLGGLSTYPDYDWLNAFSEKKGYKILLSHHPEYYLNDIKENENDTFDLIVSGHTHGGQWHVLGNNWYAPGQGMFPKYTRGRFGKLIISAGVANTVSIPRFGNPCEIVVISLREES